MVGKPLTFEESKQHIEYVKEHGIIQFINIYNNTKHRNFDKFLWGDEVEMFLVNSNPTQKSVNLSCNADTVMGKANRALEILSERHPMMRKDIILHPEFGSYMIEATPATPYGGYTTDLRLVEPNMRLRRAILSPFLGPTESLLTLTAFPCMGAKHSDFSPGGEVGQSLFVNDKLIASHPRFPTMAGNIRRRRGTKVCIKVPLYHDTNMPAKADPSEPTGGEYYDEKIDPLKEIYMDHQVFGMGNCCLQVTFQCRSITEARKVYDQHVVLAPIMLAMTAGTPFLAGKIADTDVRWDTISQSVDDRTPRERGALMTEEEKRVFEETGVLPADVIAKSRYASVSTFISDQPNLKPKYNDLHINVNQKAYDKLIENGIDPTLARHVAHLYIRDPLIIFEDRLTQDDQLKSDHFESINSTNWQSVRFKPPTPGVDIGWRVEFRTMEVQMTDFENAAYTTFIALLSRTILFFDLNYYIPITKVDENMKTAHARDAVRQHKFWMRKDNGIIKNFVVGEEVEAVWSDNKLHKAVVKSLKREGKIVVYQVEFPEFDGQCLELSKKKIEKVNDEYELQSMQEIMCGKDGNPGLIAMIETYLDIINCDSSTNKVMQRYLELIRLRATGKLLTAAQWFREFVAYHPDYKQDSHLPQSVCYDLIQVTDRIASGEIHVPRLYGDLRSPSEILSGSFSEQGGKEMRGASFMIDRATDNNSMISRRMSAHIFKSPAFTQNSPSSNAEKI